MDLYMQPLFGGAIIGVATVFYLLLTGKVVGISGILAQGLFSDKRLQAITFLVGLVIGGSAYGVLVSPSVPMPELRSPVLLIVSGLLVGYGTRLGSGCTSGHGVCGIARLSPRSILATCIFMSTAILTVFITQ